MIYAAIDGISAKTKLPEPADFNMYKADENTLKKYDKLPKTLADAKEKAAASDFIAKHLPKAMISAYTD